MDMKFSKEYKPKIFTIMIIIALSWLPLSFIIMIIYQNINIFPNIVYFEDTPVKAYVLNLIGGLFIAVGILILLLEKVLLKVVGILTIFTASVIIFYSINTYTYIDSVGIHSKPLDEFREEVILWNDIDQVLIILDNGRPTQLEFESESDKFIYTLNEYIPRTSLREWLDSIGVKYHEKNK
ncbi:HPP family protein (plasmid) [Cytobacillus firmus]|uniref:HPP family protein n=2 Tax=Cytobacillus TaxID=2675230 RepID=A0AA46P9A7_CYTFI|nr:MULTISPECIES: hypothetical protein [Cytobacillus]AND43181.1 hypothetical protein A361_28895 [Cytobacillus oceanisediminis 2691]MCM3245570.1 HPP family protein [Cytobacillus oceanisediminis]USK41685.1 HPP family protein [Cytobacillus firmus]USK47271.1 HPP family protein [Cytobacillus oceanisediminis]UYG98284.1 HPP family protein [Cytobacillus firmus]